MNFSKSQRSRASKENMAPSARVDTLQRSKQRTVLGVLSENELRGRSLSQVGDREKTLPTAVNHVSLSMLVLSHLGQSKCFSFHLRGFFI